MPADRWERAVSSDAERERIWFKPRSFVQDVWLRFVRKPTALVGLVVAVLLIAFAAAGPLFTPHEYDNQRLSFINAPPVFSTTCAPADGRYLYVTSGMKVIECDAGGRLLGQLEKQDDDFILMRVAFAYGEDSRVYLDYGVQPSVLLDARGDPLPAGPRLWNRSYLLGTDHLGRDILTRLMYGTQISLIVAFVAATVNMVIGVLYGGISAYLGGRVDSVMMRVVDIISTIPLTLYVILIKVTISSGLGGIIIALSSVYWVGMARVVRGQVLSLRQQEFVLAARTIGSGTRTILFRHLIPNAMGPILVTMMMLIPSAIFMEAFMSFIGIGIAPPMASLGTMCNDATEALRANPYQLFLPALMICMIMFAFNFVGDGLRDALDPKLKK